MHSVEILSVGNFCHDTLIHAQGTSYTCLGGPPAYSSVVLHALHTHFEVLSKVGDDFKYLDQVLKKPIVTSGKTTTFIDDYRQGYRIAHVQQICEPIYPQDVQGTSRLTLASGVMGEILPETLIQLSHKTDRLICDIQSFIRTSDPITQESKPVVQIPLEQTPFFELLDYVDFLKVSEEEARYIDLQEVRKKTQIIISEGENGCTLIDPQGGERSVPAFPTECQDPTGAGDCFLAGFAYGLLQGSDLEDAARLGNWAGSLAVQQPGVPTLDESHFFKIPGVPSHLLDTHSIRYS